MVKNSMKLTKTLLALPFLLLLAGCHTTYIQQATATMNGKCANIGGCHFHHKKLPFVAPVFISEYPHH